MSRIEDYVGARITILDILHDASRLPSCKYTTNWDAARYTLPHHSGAKRAARLLAVAICLDAEANRASEGVEKAKDGLAVARSLRSEPTQFSWITTKVVYDIILSSGLQRLLSKTEPSHEDLVSLQGDITEAADKFSVRPSFVGEIASYADSFQRMTDGRVETVIPFNDNGERRTSIELAELKFQMWFGRGITKSLWAGHTLALLKMTEYAANPTPEVLQRAADSRMYDEIFQSLRTWPHRNKLMLLPSWPGAIQQGEGLRARLRAAVTCIAALRYRNNNGAWPAGLDVLVPSYLPAVPVDPFTGQALVYKVSDNGIMVYSVGPDLKDDEGKPSLQSRPKAVSDKEWDKYDDSGFRIWK